MDFDLKQAVDEDVRIKQQPQPTMQSAPQTSDKDMNQPHSSKTGRLKKILTIVLAVLLLGGLGYGSWWYYQQQSELKRQSEARILELERENAALQAQILNVEPVEEETSDQAASEAVLASIRGAIDTNNHAALEGYMNNPVTIILAASEGLGEVSPVEAVEAMAYLAGGEGPWDFALSADEITQYQSGDYSEYFTQSSYVGRSVNNYVVVFDFADGAIASVFMTNDAGLL